MPSSDQPKKHRGARSWFPPEEHAWLFKRAEEPSFIAAALGDSRKVWQAEVQASTREFNDKFGDKIKAMLNAYEAQREAERRKKEELEKDGAGEGASTSPQVTVTGDVGDVRELEYPHNCPLHLEQLWRNRKSELLRKSRQDNPQQAAPVRLELAAPRTPQKVYNDTVRPMINKEVNDERAEHGISHLKHPGMLATRLAESFRNAPEEILERCKRVAQEEEAQMLMDNNMIYMAQEHLPGYLGSVVNSLVGTRPGQVGNLWFHGLGAYRDRDETLKFFSVDTVSEDVFGSNVPFSRQPFYPAFFERVQRYASDQVLPNRSVANGIGPLPAFNLEDVSMSRQRGMLSDHIQSHFCQVFKGDGVVPWDRIRTDPNQFLLVEPTTFTFVDPATMPAEELRPAVEYFWHQPNVFKAPLDSAGDFDLPMDRSSPSALTAKPSKPSDAGKEPEPVSPEEREEIHTEKRAGSEHNLGQPEKRARVTKKRDRSDKPPLQDSGRETRAQVLKRKKADPPAEGSPK
ncbi:hypothetical protein AAF712_015218 [Marasmius tenuissimus]|uniref:Uncharacterized protein n=1 Tax=Marasmius tenuissimus TaxID=585030 RepID=A0ABR2ZB00_9AGAR